MSTTNPLDVDSQVIGEGGLIVSRKNGILRIEMLMKPNFNVVHLKMHLLDNYQRTRVGPELQALILLKPMDEPASKAAARIARAMGGQRLFYGSFDWAYPESLRLANYCAFTVTTVRKYQPFLKPISMSTP